MAEEEVKERPLEPVTAHLLAHHGHPLHHSHAHQRPRLTPLNHFAPIDAIEEHPQRFLPSIPSPLVLDDPRGAFGHGRFHDDETAIGPTTPLGRASPIFSHESNSQFVRLHGQASPLFGAEWRLLNGSGRSSPGSWENSGPSSRVLSRAGSLEDLAGEKRVMVLYTGGTIGMKVRESKPGLMVFAVDLHREKFMRREDFLFYSNHK
ncbi:hypothetical protein CAPTEDRAFT_186428 [Capitella teleta]|uniref:Asparaginase n=1 Tax=Capitella teleta TaxID=283909 RepID=R7U330_CAPTE|nr:hypothetical protein CAPTEDRAFT_186428 [Capitella teleta]|eukprot:ELU00501.1 hypothetical protein CAPTEDRAFT_186428 [Capitella teleta]